MNENLHPGGSGYELVVGWGGKRNHSYLDSARIPTTGIGFVRYTLGVRVGHKVCMGDTMTDEEIETEFLNQIRSYGNDIKEVVEVPLTQSRFNACVSLCYNIGVVAFAKPTVVHRLDERRYKTACNVFAMWNRAGGRAIPGLANRRSLEQKEFFGSGWQFTEISEATSDSDVTGRYFCYAAS